MLKVAGKQTWWFKLANTTANMITSSTPNYWSSFQKIGFRFVLLFTFLFILTLSFPQPLIPDLAVLGKRLFEPIIRWIGDEVLQLHKPYTVELISDSTGMYVHLALLAFLSALVTAIWTIIDRHRKEYIILRHWFIVALCYYLAFQLLVYGLNKVFKWQFYLPEPNTLFTTVGNTYRDLLYWSSMGSSRAYNIFLGTSEIIAAVFLLFRNTRMVGALLAAGIMINVVAVNLSFDISVKVYSCFLLFLSLVILGRYSDKLYQLFFNRTIPVGAQKALPLIYLKTKTYYFLKTIGLAYLISSVFFDYVRTGNYNDDRYPRPPFHGAYSVNRFIINHDTIPPLTTDTQRWRRVFIHRRGYLIIQSMDDQMHDYNFLPDTSKQEWFIQKDITNEKIIFDYRATSDSILQLHTITHGDTLQIELQKIDWRKLPLLQNEFNWTIDHLE